MTREELKQEIAKLNDAKEAAMRQHEHNMYEITSKIKNDLAAVEAKKHAFMQQIANERMDMDIDTAMRHAACEEQVRYKAERMRIEDEKQQLFADYKAQANDNE